jgi:AcrR family transcriptional regulator
MPAETQVPSARRRELLELSYEYVLRNGLAEMSLRPLAEAVGSSPRVLLFLFGSKDGIIRALLARAREDELSAITRLREDHRESDLAGMVAEVWKWLADPRHRGLLKLWVERYARSLMEPDGPWGDFARSTVDDWLELLASAQAPAERDSAAALARRSQALALLRGALLDLLATEDVERTTAAVDLT